MGYRYDFAECERLLKVKGLQQEDIAKKAGVSKMTVSNFFRGKSIRNKFAVRIIRALGADVEKIVVRIGAADLLATGAQPARRRA